MRLFTALRPESVIFSVSEGRYLLNYFNGDSLLLGKGDMVIITLFNGKLAVKPRNKPGFAVDSISITGKDGNDYFTIRTETPVQQIRSYSGDLKCISDLNTILMINSCNEEDYIAGVVKAEGGGGKHIEYFKSQAVLARTYMFKYLNKHLTDGYNLCDDTHCQAYSGLSSDAIINRSVLDTKEEVVLNKDSVLVISAFHSNCGGETASSEDVWLTSVPYLRAVKDPYCSLSRNAAWQKTYSGEEWLSMISRVSHSVTQVTIPDPGFYQKSRAAVYSAGSISIPLTRIRSELNLKSTFFSVVPEGNDVVLMGKGYGHGVGLCQEGAMMMASKGFSYKQIIQFYFSGVIISDISNAIPETVIQ